MPHAFRRAAALACLVAVALAHGGCQSRVVSSSDGRPLPPPPRQDLPDIPDGAAPRMMTFTVAASQRDTNGNAFPDLILADVALFVRPEYGRSVQAPGTFVLTLYRMGEAGDPGATPLASWQIDSEDQSTWRVGLVGPGYRLRLSILDHMTDELPLIRADLVCRFEPDDPDAEVVYSDGIRSITLGRRPS